MTPVRVAAAVAVVSLALWGCRDTPHSSRADGSAVEGLVEAKAGGDTGSGPTAVLYGRVIGSDHQAAPPADWQVRVTAEYEDGTDVAPRDRDSTGDLFAFKVVPGKRVRLYFEAVPYQASVTEFLDVNDERRYASRVPDVVMDRIRWTMALFANGNGEAFGRNLEGQAIVAEKTGSADVFRANLEFYRKASAKFPDCMRKLEEFERTPRAVALSRKAEARGVPVSLLKSLVMTPAELARAEPDTLRALAVNARVARTLRNEARRALEGPPAPVAPVAPAPLTSAGNTPRR
ncbi:hypothetical protein LuPra_06127 [Luteitalea pratensis]|uniref:Uncharacterized protein n=1 Tax=Luteitalea pratensis TaxID=1855912 RepID=A0A143PXE2_LUTPR|nr:hypothetical protein [Luteitalea pratensis]AMY12843.1 hypothetical protein LuPra_06127 [Luteitalea pratensis]